MIMSWGTISCIVRWTASIIHGCCHNRPNYSKNPCLWRNRTFPNEVHHQGLESRGCKASASQAAMMHQVGKCAISAWAWVLASIPWPVRNTKAAMQKLCISTHPFYCMNCVLRHGMVDKQSCDTDYQLILWNGSIYLAKWQKVTLYKNLLPAVLATTIV